LPTPEDAVRVFVGHTGPRPQSKIEQLLPQSDQGKMNGQGQMTSAFTKRAEDWSEALSSKAKELAKQRGAKSKDPDIKVAAEAEVRKERDSERLAMLAWIQTGANEAEYNGDRFPLTEQLAKLPITPKFLVEEDGKITEPRELKIRSLFQERCA